MPYGRYKRRYKKRRGERLPLAAAMLAREAAKSLRNAKVRSDFDTLLAQGRLLNQQSAGDLFATYSAPGYRPRWVGGRGGYSLADAVRGGLSAASGLGGPIGVAAGVASSFAGRPVHHAKRGIGGSVHGNWYGSGAYTSANQLVNPSGPSKDMHITGDETNDIVLTHKEYLCDVIPTTGAFQTIYSSVQNPGLSASFPWLSQMAQYFEEYEFIQLLYTFESMVTEGNTNASGTLLMCTQYNPTSAIFNNKQQMEMYEHANSFKVTSHAVHGVECDPSKRAGSAAEYVRTGPVPSGQDPKTFDLGIFQCAVTGAYPNLMLGELWVTYTVKLSKAKIPTSGSLPGIPICMASLGAVSLSTNTGQNPFGLANNVNQYFTSDTTNPNNGTISGFYARFDGTNTSIYFPTAIEVGNYLLEFNYGFQSPQSVGGSGSILTTNCTINQGYGTSGLANSINSGHTVHVVTVNAPGTSQAVLKITTPGWIANPRQNFVCIITQLNSQTMNLNNYLLN
jgi:hypothetical protein